MVKTNVGFYIVLGLKVAVNFSRTRILMFWDSFLYISRSESLSVIPLHFIIYPFKGSRGTVWGLHIKSVGPENGRHFDDTGLT